MIRLIEELTHLQGIKKDLRNQVEELKANSIEKETRINHLKVNCQGFTSSLEKAKEEAIASFLKSYNFTNRLDQHYVAGFEDFCSNAKEAYLKKAFDSFKIPTATESSFLQTSFEDINIIDDASTEPIKDKCRARQGRPKVWRQCPQWFISVIFISFRKIYLFLFRWECPLFWAFLF